MRKTKLDRTFAGNKASGKAIMQAIIRVKGTMKCLEHALKSHYVKIKRVSRERIGPKG